MKINWEAVSATATCVAALFAAVSAWAASRTATQNAVIGRTMNDALAASTKPEIQLAIEQRPTDIVDGWKINSNTYEEWATVINTSQWPAVDVELDIELNSGRRIQSRWDRLEAPSSGLYPATGTRDRVRTREPRLLPEDLDEAPKEIRVLYSDEHRAARYVRVYGFFDPKDGQLYSHYEPQLLREWRLRDMPS